MMLMKNSLPDCLLFLLLLTFSIPAYSGSIILGVNLEFVDGRFNDEAFDGGWGLHLGYEFKEWKKWQFGAMFEYMDGWYDPEDLEIAGEMMYDSQIPVCHGATDELALAVQGRDCGCRLQGLAAGLYPGFPRRE